jgi:hypothetical protein
MACDHCEADLIDFLQSGWRRIDAAPFVVAGI